MERGFLAMATEGSSCRAAAADFGRCLQLGGNLHDDELFATLGALFGYYIARADLRRAAQVLESLRAGLEQGRQWFRPAFESQFGIVAWLRGEFAAADSHLEAATAGQGEADCHRVDAMWFQPNDPIATAHLHLALTRLVRGDLTGAEAELAYAARRVEALGFPQGQYTLANARFVESWMRIETGQLDRAGALAAELTELAERHGLDHWRRVGAIQQVVVGALAALDADDLNPTARSARTATITRFVDTWRTAEEYMYLTFFDSVLGRLLIAASQPEAARERLDTGLQLAQDTGMRFYDAELLRLRAHTHTDPDARRRDITGALALARRQGATLFELRAALDDFELRGEPARAALVDVASRISTNNTWPELARAQAALSEQS